MSALEKLASIGGPALGPPIDASFRVDDRLVPLLAVKNGFYAFESALHVFSWPDAERWNSPGLWRKNYPDLPAELVFFAEDVFGEQFFLGNSGIGRFNPETGDTEPVADTVESWAEAVLDDYEVATGHPVAHEWQVRHGPLEPGIRLLPKIPFVANGEYVVENVYAVNALKGMLQRADFARQIRDLPDGATFTYKVVE